jgi:hypothetical protein
LDWGLLYLLDHSLDVIELGQWKFHIIQIEDMDMYALYIKQTRYPAILWSSNFAYMWAISQSDKLKLLWQIIDGLLVTFVHSSKNSLYLFCLPFGDADPEQIIDVTLKCTRYCNDWNGQERRRAVIKMINDDQLAFLRESPRFNEYFTTLTWQGIERHFDINKLVTLEGNEFSNVRRRVHKFYRDNPYAEISRYQDADFEELMELDNRWRNTSGSKYAKILDRVYYKELVKHCYELDQLTLVMKINSRIIGMVSGGVLPTGQSWGSVVKFDENFPGLSETLIVELANEIHKIDPKTALMNVGSDLGPGGLREYKLKFRPVLNLKRYQIHLK